MAPKQQFGFTLMELMIAVAIVGILAAIAIPSYQDSVRKSRRRDAESVLLGLANAMERHFTESNSYCDAGSVNAVTDCGDARNDTGTPDLSIFSIPAETAQFYTVTISSMVDVDTTSQQAAGFTLSAVPIGDQASDKCLILSLNHRGEKDNSAGLPLADCW